jgi:hypothetical protein
LLLIGYFILFASGEKEGELFVKLNYRFNHFFTERIYFVSPFNFSLLFFCLDTKEPTKSRTTNGIRPFVRPTHNSIIDRTVIG